MASWDDPIEKVVTPHGGKPIATLSDARAYILKLPRSVQKLSRVQDGTEAIIMAAEGRGPMHTAQAAIALIVHGPAKPLNRGKPDRPWLKRKAG